MLQIYTLFVNFVKNQTMKKVLPLLLSALLASLVSCSGDKTAPVNPDASPEARKLLSYLYSISGKYTLSGEHNFASDLER